MIFRGIFIVFFGLQTVFGFAPKTGIVRTHSCYLRPFEKSKTRSQIVPRNERKIIGDDESMPPSPSPSHSPLIRPGLVLGIPLNLLSAIYTYHHYHEFSLTPKIIALNCLVGFYTYGNDRVKDAIYTRNITTQSAYLTENRYILKNIYDSAYLAFVILLFDNDGTRFQTLGFLSIYETLYIQYPFFFFYLGVKPAYLFGAYLMSFLVMWNSGFFEHEFVFLPFLLALDSTNFYIEFKKRCGLLKPFYVAFMWVGAFLIMPIVVREQSWMDVDFREIWSPFFMMAGLSNFLDLKDIESDRNQGIRTIPVLVGEKLGIAISIVFWVLSKLLFE